MSIANALIEYETLTAEQIERVVKGESIAEDFADKPVKEESTEAAETTKIVIPEEKPTRTRKPRKQTKDE